MVREIRMNTGEIALVDDEDYPVVSRYSWRKVSQKGYAGTTIKSSNGVEHTIYMQHLILATSTQIDHENESHRDNQKANMRVATYQQNGWNKGKPNFKKRESTSQFKGVRRVESKTLGTRWLASLKHVEPGKHKSTGKMIYIGYFASEIEAARAYNAKVRELRGEWAWVNPLPDDESKNQGKSVA